MAGEADIWQPRTILELSADTKRITQAFTAITGQTLFNITDFAYVLGTGALQIFKNGLLLAPGVDWVENTDTTFSIVIPGVAGDEIVAVGYSGITGTVDTRDTDIFLANYQAIRDYAGTETTVYALGIVTAGDNGQSFFQKFTGAALGFYVDDNNNIIIPTGGDGTIGWVRSHVSRLDLASTVAGKGASLVNFESGKTVQDLASIATDDGSKGFHLVNVPPSAGEAGVVNYEYSIGDIKRYGAVGDGATLDNTAFTTAEATSLEEIYLPHGTYVVTGLTLTKSYVGPGIIELDGVDQDRDPDWSYAQSNGARSVIRYYNATGVFVTDKAFTMNEFRVAGQYTRLKAPTWDNTDDLTIIDTASNRFGSASAVKLNNWHGAFACANQGDAAVSTQAIPFLRARSVAGSVITLGLAGTLDDELGGLLPAATYTWNPAELVGTKVLVIREELLATKVNMLAARVATITAATTTTITLDTIGTIGARDWLLPAPSGYDYFRYLGTFYFDIAEVSNIYDSGSRVGWLGTSNANFTNNYQGSQATPIAIPVGGYISPLATAVILYAKYTCATASLGDLFEKFGGDISHLWDLRYDVKNETGNRSVRHNDIEIPFLWRQEYAYANSGSLVATKGSDEHYPYGWVEP